MAAFPIRDMGAGDSLWLARPRGRGPVVSRGGEICGGHVLRRMAGVFGAVAMARYAGYSRRGIVRFVRSAMRHLRRGLTRRSWTHRCRVVITAGAVIVRVIITVVWVSITIVTVIVRLVMLRPQLGIRSQERVRCRRGKSIKLYDDVRGRPFGRLRRKFNPDKIGTGLQLTVGFQKFRDQGAKLSGLRWGEFPEAGDFYHLEFEITGGRPRDLGGFHRSTTAQQNGGPQGGQGPTKGRLNFMGWIRGEDERFLGQNIIQQWLARKQDSANAPAQKHLCSPTKECPLLWIARPIPHRTVWIGSVQVISLTP